MNGIWHYPCLAGQFPSHATTNESRNVVHFVYLCDKFQLFSDFCLLSMTLILVFFYVVVFLLFWHEDVMLIHFYICLARFFLYVNPKEEMI
jgi:hypothetical protein